jgi:hypothetical protein
MHSLFNHPLSTGPARILGEQDEMLIGRAWPYSILCAPSVYACLGWFDVAMRSPLRPGGAPTTPLAVNPMPFN